MTTVNLTDPIRFGDTLPTGPSGVAQATKPLNYNPTTKTVSIDEANASQAGYLSAEKFAEFDGKPTDADLAQAVAAATTALQGEIAAEATARQAADAALSSTVADAQAAASRVATDLAQEVADRTAADAQTLDDAKGYTDAELAKLVNGAPEALNTIKEIADWIANDETGTAALINRVGTSETDIEALQVAVPAGDAATLAAAKAYADTAAAASNRIENPNGGNYSEQTADGLVVGNVNNLETVTVNRDKVLVENGSGEQTVVGVARIGLLDANGDPKLPAADADVVVKKYVDDAQANTQAALAQKADAANVYSQSEVDTAIAAAIAAIPAPSAPKLITTLETDTGNITTVAKIADALAGIGTQNGWTINLGFGEYREAGPIVFNEKWQLQVCGPRSAMTTAATIKNGITIQNSNGVRLQNVQVEGASSIASRAGLGIYADRCQFMGNITLSGTGSFMMFTDCDFAGNITIPNTFAGVIYLIRCNLSGASATYSFSQTSAQQVILVDCSGIPNTGIAKASFSGSTVYKNGSQAQFVGGIPISTAGASLSLPLLKFNGAAFVPAAEPVIEIPDARTTTSDALTVLDADLAAFAPAPVPGAFAGTVRPVTTEAQFNAAITAAADGDVIDLGGSTITFAATANVSKAVKVQNGIMQSAGTTADPVTLVNVTAAAWLASSLTIKHRKTSNTSVETAVSATATGFVSDATVEFMEFGLVLRGSFTVGGKTVYTGALGNNHRHIGIYNLSAPSKISGVEFDFPQEATARSNFILVSSNNPTTERFESLLTIENCRQKDMSKFCRQFFMMEAFQVTNRNASLVCRNNTFNDLNGGIGFFAAATTPLNFFDVIALVGNVQGLAGKASYKGLLYVDGSGTGFAIGAPTRFAVIDNVCPQTLRADYSPAYGAFAAFKNTTFTGSLTPYLGASSVGPQGVQGIAGTNGTNGTNGIDGTSITITTVNSQAAFDAATPGATELVVRVA